jgi:hypothetical protein
VRIDTTSDSPSWTKVFQITDELSHLNDMLEKKYPGLEWELSVCMRCLPKKLERKTFSRYYAQEKMLALDIALDEEEFLPIKNNKAAQRKLIGTAFLTFFIESINKYEKKLPGLQPVSVQLVSDVHDWCIEGGWTN